MAKKIIRDADGNVTGTVERKKGCFGLGCGLLLAVCLLAWGITGIISLIHH